MSIAKSHQVTRDNLAGRPDISTVIKVNRSDIELVEGPTQVKVQDIGGAFILAHEVNGVLGFATATNGATVTLGTSSYGSLTTERVLNFNNEFLEYLRDDDFKDTTNTTATTNTSTHVITFNDGDKYVSKTIFKNDVNLATGTIESVPNLVNNGTATYYLSPKTYVDDAIFYWNFDEGTGTSFVDQITSLSGTINLTYAGWTAGLTGTGIETDGDSSERSKVIFSDASDLTVSESDKTYLCWVKFNNFASNMYFFDRYVWRFYTASTNIPRFMAGRMTDGTGPSISVSGQAMSADTWYMFAAHYHPDPSGGNGYIQLFQNGVSQSVASIGALTYYQDYGSTSGKNIRFGTTNHGTWTPFEGVIDEAGVFEGLIPEATLLEMYNEGIAGRLQQGTNWNEATLGEPVSFTTDGQELRYRIDINGGTATISSEDGDGYSSPIKISYTTRQ